MARALSDATRRGRCDAYTPLSSSLSRSLSLPLSFLSPLRSSPSQSLSFPITAPSLALLLAIVLPALSLFFPLSLSLSPSRSLLVHPSPSLSLPPSPSRSISHSFASFAFSFFPSSALSPSHSSFSRSLPLSSFFTRNPFLLSSNRDSLRSQSRQRARRLVLLVEHKIQREYSPRRLLHPLSLFPPRGLLFRRGHDKATISRQEIRLAYFQTRKTDRPRINDRLIVATRLVRAYASRVHGEERKPRFS